jgi:hypothetical protein
MDLALALIITLMMYGTSHSVDYIFFEEAYYPQYDHLHFIGLPLVTIAMLLAGKPLPLYITGVALAYFLSYTLYIVIDTIWPRDMVGMDHWLAAPGALIGAIAALILLKKSRSPTQIKALAFGLTGTLTGFIVANEFFCNTVTYCGPLSVLFYRPHM